jgi:hypothetical protein
MEAYGILFYPLFGVSAGCWDCLCAQKSRPIRATIEQNGELSLAGRGMCRLPWLRLLLWFLLGLFLRLFLALCVGLFFRHVLSRLLGGRFFGSVARLLTFGFLTLNRVVYFSAMNWYLFRCCYAQPNLIPAHIDDGDLDIIADHN